MDIAHIRTFIEVSRARHFGKAAKALFITQSAVSTRIRMLEESLGVKLLTRDRNNIQLTAAGIRFLPMAEQILNTWNLAKQTTGLEEESKTLLTIGGVFSLWESGIQKTIFDFCTNNTNMAVNLVADVQEQLLHSIIDGNVDVGLMYEQPQLSELESIPLGSLDLVLVTTNKQLNVENALSNANYVYVNWGTAFSMTHAKLFPNIPAPAIRVDFSRIALDFLLEHGGSAYLAKSMIKEELINDKLFIIEDAPVINRQYYLVFQTNSAKHDAIVNLQKSFPPVPH